MATNAAQAENDLVVWTLAWLRERLPPEWAIELSTRGFGAAGGRPDAAIEVRTMNVQSTIAVEAKRSLAPREVDRLLGGVGRTLRALTPVPILVVAPWLSARTRILLAAEGLNYLDQTGNAAIRLDNPALFIRSEGASRDPAPAHRSKARVRGPKASRLVRTLVDIRPPYGVRELAEAAQLAPGYVSQLLDALDEDALVERSRRGRVEEVDVPGLLRRWAATYDVFKANEGTAFLAPGGAAQILARLADPKVARTAVTGSFAAVRVAPVAAPALLTVYCEDGGTLAQALDLLPADQGANVVVLRPFDPVVWVRADESDGVSYVAPSQAVVDCLTGNGRMPAEGEAVLSWMRDNEQAWRRDALPRAPAREIA